MKTKRSPRGQSPKPTLSAARLAANRQNARKSTGPRTPEGKARASRNATKHGLAAAACDQPTLEKVTALAAALAEGSTDWDVRAYAHSVAEAQLDLERVWEARVREHEAAGPGFSSKERSPAGWVLRLSRLERYERRAFSRRSQAIRGLEAAKAGPCPRSPLVECGRRVAAEFWQNEAIGAACQSSGENWQNEASEADNQIPKKLPKKLEAAIPLHERTWAPVVSPTTGGTQSAGVRQNEAIEARDDIRQNEASEVLYEDRQNEATEPGAPVAAPRAGGPEASAAPTPASGGAAMRPDPNRRDAQTQKEKRWRPREHGP